MFSQKILKNEIVTVSNSIIIHFFRHYSCLAASSGLKEVSVCLLPSGTESGMRQVQCAIARVEEHYRLFDVDANKVECFILKEFLNITAN
jgi:hypothetical protein